ncbi:MAG: type II toxin-antitoxin system RelE/ParE family toxin [Oleibacter sp.]|nr:type II toxin-antitoxin system RelE/ParE family toxin [Thalassolituus sp.]
MKSLRFYRARNGKQPFIDWLQTLKDLSAIALINTRIRRLAIGQRGDCKRVGKGVYELRIHSGPGYRVYFSEVGKDVIILLLGGSKKAQKRDIKQAITYWLDFKERLHG